MDNVHILSALTYDDGVALSLDALHSCLMLVFLALFFLAYEEANVPILRKP